MTSKKSPLKGKASRPRATSTPNLNPSDEPKLTEDEIDAKADHLVEIARTLVADWPRFHPMLAPEAAKNGIRAFKKELRSRAFTGFCVDYAERPVGGGDLTLDYLIGSTVVEIAMNLRDQNSTFERSILKVLMAEKELHRVTHLLFLSKTGARARCNTPNGKAIMAWAEMEYGVRVEVRELGASAENILDIGDD